VTVLIVPEETELTAPYWDGARAGELRLQRCGACDHTWHPPLPRCPRCTGDDVSWYAAAGTGVLHSFTITHQAAHPAFAERVPYAVALVRLEEGPLVVANVLDAAPDELAVGQPLTVAFQEIAPGVVLPQFRAR
jgi:uncharacterized OB-fold protein